jgi:hypothetical protein
MTDGLDLNEALGVANTVGYFQRGVIGAAAVIQMAA